MKVGTLSVGVMKSKLIRTQCTVFTVLW